MPNVRYVGFRAATVWVLTLLLTGLAWSQPMSSVTGVKVSQNGQMLNVEVGASGRVQHRSKVLTSPQKIIVVDVFPAKLKDGVPTEASVAAIFAAIRPLLPTPHKMTFDWHLANWITASLNELLIFFFRICNALWIISFDFSPRRLHIKPAPQLSCSNCGE